MLSRTQPLDATERAGAGWAALGRALAFVALVGLVAATRVWQIAGRGAVWWNDSADFLSSARSGLFSLERWAGPRTAAAPLILSLARFEPRTYVNWQAAIAALCWGALALSVWTLVAGRRARWVAALAVVAFSCTVAVTMWERSVLSESLAASTLALVLAAGLRLAQSVTGPRVAAVLAAAALWLLTRDSHASVVLVAAVALAVWLVVETWRGIGGPDDRSRGRFSWLVVLACGLFVLGAFALGAASHGNRYAYPLRNVFEVRVLPYPDRVAWFADHGMPQAERFVGPGALAPIVDRGQAPVTYVADDDPTLQEWLAWIERDGREAFAAWVATHPTYLVTEPMQDPERTFNNALGHRGFYAPADQREVPLVTDVLAPGPLVTLGVATAVAVWATLRRRWSSPLLLVGAVTVVLAAPHGLVSWHSDGMETARHLVVPVLQLQLGTLLMVIGALGRQAVPDVASEG
jgi:hypothetical protein